MEQNNNIISARNKFIVILCVFVFIQICFLFAVNTVIGYFFTELQTSENLKTIIKPAAYLVIAILSLIVDFLFVARILKLQKLSHIEPVWGSIEDIVIYSYRGDGKRKYKVYLIVKDEHSNKLLFTYGRYSLSFYNFTVTGANKKLVNANVFRKDGSVAKIGDTVRVYKSKSVNVDVKIDDKIMKLNNKSFPFYNMNSKYGKDIFVGMEFFEGAIDVEV